MSELESARDFILGGPPDGRCTCRRCQSRIEARDNAVRIELLGRILGMQAQVPYPLREWLQTEFAKYQTKEASARRQGT